MLPIAELHVGVAVSHPLVANYLHHLLTLQLNLNPVLLPDPVIAPSLLPVDGDLVILIDLHDLPLPVSTCLEAFRLTRNVSAFVALDHPRASSDIAHLLFLGFSGFLAYDQIPERLGEVIGSVKKGEIWATADVLRKYVTLTSHRTTITESGSEVLTKREDQILDLLRKRYSNKEIATFLGICESTVKFHVSNVLAKLNATRRSDLSHNHTNHTALSLVCRNVVSSSHF
jgi:DNA-binding NarL/FixJ family response regulator